jgi:hypothetical protein
MRDTYQQDKPAQTTVAEDLAAPAPQAMPDSQTQGVAALPTGDMYNEQNFATGGIVAFDDGGEVSNYRQDQSALNLNLAGKPSEDSKDGNPVNSVANLLGMARMGGLSPNMGMPGGVNGMGSGDPMGLLGLLGLGKQALQPKSYALNLNSGKQEAQYADGGIVAFAQGGRTDPSEYDPWYYKEEDVVLAPVPKPKTLDDVSYDMQRAQERFGVDPKFYADQARKLQEEREALKADKSNAGWMALTRAGLGMAAGTSPFALKNISEGAIQGVTQYGADVKDIKAQDRLLKQADMKLAEAQQAQARGDASTAMKAMDERDNIIRNIEVKNAELLNQSNIARSKNKATLAGKEGDLNSKIYDKALKDFTSSFPSGSASGVFRDNPGFLQFVKNVYLKNAQDYIRSGTMPSIPNESQLLDMFNKGKDKSATATKPASSLSGENSPLAATRPTKIQSILDKYPATGSRSRNTQEELDQPWDLVGQGLED